MAKPLNFPLDDEQGRDIIQALSVHARDLAGHIRDTPDVSEQKRKLEKVKRLDALRHQLEAATDAAA